MMEFADKDFKTSLNKSYKETEGYKGKLDIMRRELEI